jgi:hypothetical protein
MESRHTAGTRLRSIRFPADLWEHLAAASREAGMSVNAYVVDVLRGRLAQTAPESEWLGLVRDWLLATHSPTEFPQDVTRLAFHHIRDTPALREGYERLVRDAAGEVDPYRRADLHKQVGRMVKEALRADVVGRVVDLDPAENLIRSHALLRPAQGKRVR